MSNINSIPKNALRALGQAALKRSSSIQNLEIPTDRVSVTAVKTQDLRLDVHKNTKDSTLLTGIIQANSEAKDASVRKFIKGRTGGHSGTHQVIGYKIPFAVGSSFDADGLAAAIEKAGDVGEGNVIRKGSVVTTSAQSADNLAWYYDQSRNSYYRLKAGTNEYEWRSPPEGAELSNWTEWTWDHTQKKYYMYHRTSGEKLYR